MNFAYIGAIVGAILLIGFSVVAVILVARSVKKSIRERTLELISDYDKLIEKKSVELMELQQESEENAAAQQITAEAAPTVSTTSEADPAAMLRAVSRISTSTYRDSAIGSVYSIIRNGFRCSVKEALEHIPEEELTASEGAATKLLKELPFKVIYELSSLSPDEQYTVMSETLTGSQKEMLDAYRETNQCFDSIGFYDYLQQKSSAEPAPCFIRVSPYSRPKDIPEGMTIEEDEAICEGFELVTNSRVYDYSVKIREIS